MKIEYKVIAGSIAFGLAVWTVDAAIDYFFFYESTFWELMITDIPKHELYIRLPILAFFTTFGILMSNVVGKLKRTRDELRNSNQQLVANEQQLKATNQQLVADEQQLKAANQQFVASDQQLKAANQQLVADEQQLKAANQQLVADEQQLKAANQQLVASDQQLRATNQELVAGERKLRQQSGFLRNVINSIGNPFYVIDANDYTIIDANDYAVKLANCTDAGTNQLTDKTTCYALTHGLDKPCGSAEHQCPIELVKRTKKPAVVEHAHCNRDSRGHVFEYHAHPIFDEAGEVFQIIEYSLDITDRKKAEEEVAKLAKFPDENLNPVLRISREGEILYANTGSRPLLDAWQTELHDCIPQKWYELVQQASHSDQMRQCEIKCGEQIFSLTFTPVADFGYVNIYGMDITDRKKAEADREYVLKELTAKTKELESIVYVASHDLRSPLVNIQGFSQELRDNCTLIRSTLEKEEFKSLLDKDLLTVLDKDIPEAVRFISASTRMMDSLLSGLLRLSRLSQVKLEIRKLDMNALMSNVVGSMSYQIKEVAAKVQIDPLDSCLGDESQIGQIFINVLDNALKYLDNSRPGMIHVSCSEKDDHCVYCVEDNGIGIDLEHQNKIFEIFHRLDPGRTEGEGLGLTTARRILDRHDGSIWVESEPGKASRFFVSVPKA